MEEIQNLCHGHLSHVCGQLHTSGIELDAGFKDKIPFIGKDKWTMTVDHLNAALKKDPNNAELIKLHDTLYHLAQAYNKIAHTQLMMVEAESENTRDKDAEASAIKWFRRSED